MSVHELALLSVVENDGTAHAKVFEIELHSVVQVERSVDFLAIRTIAKQEARPEQREIFDNLADEGPMMGGCIRPIFVRPEPCIERVLPRKMIPVRKIAL